MIILQRLELVGCFILGGGKYCDTCNHDDSIVYQEVAHSKEAKPEEEVQQNAEVKVPNCSNGVELQQAAPQDIAITPLYHTPQGRSTLQPATESPDQSKHPLDEASVRCKVSDTPSSTQQ